MPMKRRTIWAISAVVSAIIVVVLVLLFLPLESASISQTISTKSCTGLSPCSTQMIEFQVGDSRYATLTGDWLTSVNGSDVIITINNGPSSQPCSLCSDLLYSSLGSTTQTGSFDVSGSGPFHVSVNQIGDTSQTTIVSGTLDSAVV